jgi:cytochrome c-type biogenesis protein CcmH
VDAPAPAAGPDPEFAALMDKLRAAIDPATATDPRGLDLLARNEAALGNLRRRRGRAAPADRRQKRGQASADDLATLAEIMIRAAGGYISPEAEAELIRALEIDPKNGIARYFSGLMFAQGGRYDRAFALWEPLLRDSPPEAPWMVPLRDQIETVAARAGVNFTLPGAESAPGPTAGDMAAAAEMTPEERQAMIEGMVGQLAGAAGDRRWQRRGMGAADHLAGRPWPPDEARAAYAEAQRQFEGMTVELQGLREAAVTAGVAE